MIDKYCIINLICHDKMLFFHVHVYVFNIANFRKEISDQVQTFAQLVHHKVTH